VKLGIVDFSEVALYLCRLIRDQKSSSFSPVHIEKGKVSAVEESIVGQIYAPHILIINTSKYNEMVLSWDMQDYFAAFVQTLKSLDVSLSSSAIKAQTLQKPLHRIKTGCFIGFAYQLSELRVGCIRGIEGD
jgi:hypothetical protein